MRRALAALVLASLVSGCALLGKQDPLVPRYFSPETADGSLGAGHAAATDATRALSLRLARVGGGTYLKERIVFRSSSHELGFYEDRRWTERPEIYLQRALERAFFEERGLQRALVGSAPTLTADLIEFEEVRGATPGARVRVSYALHDDRAVVREATLTVERPLAAGNDASQAERVVAALADAMQAAVAQMAEQVVTDLAARATAAPSAPAR